jgi:hypothetical protein
MIVHITEQFHDYQPQRYYVNTDDLDAENPIDKLVLDACNKDDFCNEVFVNVEEKRNSEPDNEFWEDPAGEYLLRTAVDGSTVPAKAVYIQISFG